MDGVPCSWSTTRAQESFSRSRAAADTLSRLAKLVARAEQRQDGRSKRQHSLHVCLECGLGFPDRTELLHHQEVKHALPKPHRCPPCGKEFSLLSSLQLHKCACDSSPCKLCQGEPRLGAPCPACMAGASDPDSPQDKSPHRQPHHLNSSPYACALCGRGFSQKQALLYHQQAGCTEPHCQLTVDNASSPPADSPPVSEAGSTLSDSSDTPGPSSTGDKACPFCSRTFSSAAGLSCHKRIIHGVEVRIAPQKTKEEGAGGEKAKVNGNSIGRPKSKQKLLSCRSCDMVLKGTAKLYLHRKEKHSRDKSIKRETRQVKHRKGDLYPCQICGRVFLHHLSLLAHSKQHTGSTFTAVQRDSKSVGNTAKDSKLADKKPNKLNPSLTDTKAVTTGPGRPGLTDNKTVKAGPGRPVLTDNKTVKAGPGRPGLTDNKTFKAGPGRPVLTDNKTVRAGPGRPVLTDNKTVRAGPGRPVLTDNKTVRAGPGRPVLTDNKTVRAGPGRPVLTDNKTVRAGPGRPVLTDNKTVRAGPGRPSKKVARLEEQFNDPGRCREVPEVEEVDREFPCPSCVEVFSLQSELRDHVELHQSVRRKQCSVCNQGMDISKEPGSKRQRLYHCVPCQRGFSALDIFLKHCQDHLRVRVEEDNITENYNQQGNKNEVSF